MKHFVPILALIALPEVAIAGHKKPLAPANGLKNKGFSPKVQPSLDDNPRTSDPLEKVNRVTFAFNHAIYKCIMQPIAKGTEAVLPNRVLQSFRNFGQNVEAPVRIVNRLFQAKPKEAGREFTKFIVDSTAGVGGFMKPSESFPSLRNSNPADTGQSLGKAGIPSGPYLVLPVLGPSNCRDLVGKVGDWAMNPLVYIGASNVHAGVRSSIGAIKGIDENRQRMKAYQSTVELTVDPYIAVREAYTRYRANAVSGS